MKTTTEEVTTQHFVACTATGGKHGICGKCHEQLRMQRGGGNYHYAMHIDQQSPHYNILNHGACGERTSAWSRISSRESLASSRSSCMPPRTGASRCGARVPRQFMAVVIKNRETRGSNGISTVACKPILRFVIYFH